MRRIATASAVLGVLVWLATSSSGPRLITGDGQEPPNGGYGVGTVIPSASETRNFAESNLCLAGDGSLAVVTGLEFIESSNLRILDYGVREYALTPTGTFVDVTQGTLRDAGFQRTPVTVPCGDPEKVTFLGYELGIDGSTEGWGKWLAVSYVVDGRPGRLVLPASVRMCVNETLEPTCKPAHL